LGISGRLKLSSYQVLKPMRMAQLRGDRVDLEFKDYAWPHPTITKEHTEENKPDMLVQFAHDIDLTDPNYVKRPTYQGGWGEYDAIHKDPWFGQEIKDGDSIFMRHSNDAEKYNPFAKKDKQISGSWMYLQGSMVPEEGFAVGFPHHILGFSGKQPSMDMQHWEDVDDEKSTANRFTIRKAVDSNVGYIKNRNKQLLLDEAATREQSYKSV